MRGGGLEVLGSRLGTPAMQELEKLLEVEGLT